MVTRNRENISSVAVVYLPKRAKTNNVNLDITFVILGKEQIKRKHENKKSISSDSETTNLERSFRPHSRNQNSLICSRLHNKKTKHFNNRS